MRKWIAIGLACLLLYNTVGYYALFLLRQQQAREQLRNYLDRSDTPLTIQQQSANGLADDKWIVFRIPLDFYHQIDRDPVPVEGEFNYQGKIYEKALMGIKNDTILLYCVNNQRQEKIQREFTDHAKATTAAHPAGKPTKTAKSVLPEYLPSPVVSVVFPARYIESAFLFLSTAFFRSALVEIPYPPPRQS